MSLIDNIYEKARAVQKTIILPESLEERTLKATSIIIQEKLAKIILLGDPSEIQKKATDYGTNIERASIRNFQNDPKLDIFIDELVKIRKDKGLTTDKAKSLLKDPLYFAALMVKFDEADGYVSGAIHSTGDVLRPALQIIKTSPDCKTVSSFFIMVLPDESPYSKIKQELFFADCAVVPSPTANELADIAISTAKSFSSIVQNDHPRIAMLSFSTKGSAKHQDVEKITEATEIIKEKNCNLLIDGELQADAALIHSVGEQKSPGSLVAGKANILIFPDLNSGNISYKLVQRLSGATAIGPIVQGLAKPVNDLSRGCSVEDIVDTVSVTACQAAL